MESQAAPPTVGENNQNNHDTRNISPDIGSWESTIGLSHSRVGTYQPPNRQRARKACTNCREHKAKCSGDQPCDRCRHSRVDCVYGPRKQEKEESEFQKLKGQIKEYRRLLSELQSSLSDPHRSVIAQTLKRQTTPSSEVVPEHRRPGFLDASVPSSVLTDSIQEDFNRNSNTRATGFIGAHSETSRIYNLNRQTAQQQNGSSISDYHTEPRSFNSVSAMSYFLDNTKLPIDRDVDTSILPPRHVADRLWEIYINHVHPTFPILGRYLFQDQYDRVYTTPPLNTPKKWLAILNLAFALAARYSGLVDGTAPEDEWFRASVYFSRATKLRGVDNLLLDHPDLQQIQLEGLLSLYLLSIGQVNRAWRVCHLAISSAVSMGINLKNRSDDTSTVSKEIRYRVWWSIYVLETNLSAMTGRPPGLADHFCTAPLPLPFDEELFRSPAVAPLLADLDLRSEFLDSILSSDPGRCDSGFPDIVPNSSLYFFYVATISRLSRQAINLRYITRNTAEQQLEVITSVTELPSAVDPWLGLPSKAFQFAEHQHQNQETIESLKYCLAFQLYSTQIIAGAVPLGSQSPTEMNNGTPTSTGLEKEGSDLAVDAACQMLSLLPDIPDVVCLMRMSPWWCILHYLMQAITVLLMEIHTYSHSDLDLPEELLAYVKKGIHWVSSMAANHSTCQRAWELSSELYARVTANITGLTPM